MRRKLPGLFCYLQRGLAGFAKHYPSSAWNSESHPNRFDKYSHKLLPGIP